MRSELQFAMTSFFKSNMDKRNQQNSKTKLPSISAPSNSRKVSNSQTHHNQIVKTSYSSNPVQIPPDFLKVIPTDAEPITVERVNFATSTLPEYAPYYATVLDNVLSPSECAELLQLAVLSSPTGDWAPALVNAGIGYEIMRTDVRHCDRYFITIVSYSRSS
jgi:hypothetical protein